MKRRINEEISYELGDEYLGIPETKYSPRRWDSNPTISYNGKTFSEDEIWKMCVKLYQNEVGKYPKNYFVLQQWLQENLARMDEIINQLDACSRKINESTSKRTKTMKKLNITKEQFEKSRYFKNKYGTLEYVSESGKVFKTSKGQLLKFNERTRFMNTLDVEELIFAALNKAGGVIEVKRTDNGYILATKDNDFKIDLNIEQIDDSYDYN